MRCQGNIQLQVDHPGFGWEGYHRGYRRGKEMTLLHFRLLTQACFHPQNIVMPHQWMEGNLPVSAKCIVCDKTCGSVMRLQDWRCLWCRSTVHTACRPQAHVACPLGPARVSVVPPISLHSIGIDDAWDVCKPHGSFSPLLVFVNSKSGDNQGVKFLRRFKQLLNPAQVFDLISTGPGLGLRLFRHFDPFRILICSGDGSVGWVLSEIDQLNMTVSMRGLILIQKWFKHRQL